MKGLKYGLLAAMSVGGLSAASNAAVILNDSFDTYADQASFEAVWPSIGSTTDTTKKSAQLSTAQSVSAPNSVFVPISTTATGTSTEYRNRRSFAETSTLSSSGNLGIGDQLIWSFDFYDSITGNPPRNYANLQDSTGPGAINQLVSMGLNNNLDAVAQDGNYYMARILSGASNGGAASAYFKLNDAGAPLRSVGWHNLKVVISTDDGVSTDYRFYVDGTLAETVLDQGAAGTLRSYDNVVIGSGFTNGSAVAYFDNMYVEYIAVPEPTSLALLGLVGAGLLSRRRA